MFKRLQQTIVKKYTIKNFEVLWIFAITVFLFFSIDWISKKYLFDVFAKPRDYVVFGVRSFPHDNSTLLSAFNFKLPLWTTHTINFSLASLFSISIFFVKKVFLGISIGIVVSGILGNGLDILLTDDPSIPMKNFVRDIIYIPWWDRGTFNFADLFIVVGSILMAVNIFKFYSIDKKAKKVHLINTWKEDAKAFKNK